MEIQVGSDRSFGIVFAVVFAIIGLYPLFYGSVRWWALAVASVFLALAIFSPSVLHPLNMAWFRFGMLLNKIVSPIVMGVLFLVAIVPFGLFFRLRKRDPLRKKLDPDASSYWIPVDEEIRAQSSMRNQF
ncbi:SxtJ family membrane protein [Marimonas arenosa]|uniref:SxtJ family membrane protein n=1 Tax=Marimonas arenosa TaxID=1795305 RepID=A0AAE4B534_9RHOB|nr:SxtJ family membrane protein [Marimonas arenosa]MDQ2089959.1 SxtJ family membrane protein [Marimonas arenosa]